jgi:glutathione S-transferase
VPEELESAVQEWLEFSLTRLGATLLASVEQPDVSAQDAAIAEAVAKQEWLAGSTWTAADIVVASCLLSASDGSGLSVKTHAWLKVRTLQFLISRPQ